MNLDNLHELINRYEENLNTIYNDEHDELFKWRGMKTWQDEWFKPEDAFESFAERFTAAKRDFLLFTDNSRMHPSAGVIKLWEKESEAIESLFYDAVFCGLTVFIYQCYLHLFFSFSCSWRSANPSIAILPFMHIIRSVIRLLVKPILSRASLKFACYYSQPFGL